MKINLKSDAAVVYTLAKRNLKLYLRDKATVFFSLLAPIIILGLYILFLRDVQLSSVRGIFEGYEVSDKAIGAFVDSWLVSGVVAVCCLTIALNSGTVMVSDREKGINHDYLIAPVRPVLVTLGYFFAFFAVSVLITCIVSVVCMLFLVISGSFYLSVASIFECLGVIILSCLSSTMFMVFILSFFKTISAVSAFAGLFSAVIGFIIGAYMPTSIFPLPVQYFTTLIPGSYSSALFRNVFMSGPLEQLAAGMPAELISQLSGAFSLDLNFFGYRIGVPVMYAVLAFSVVLFFVVNFIVRKCRRKEKSAN